MTGKYSRNVMYQILLVVFLLVAVSLVTLIMLQQGRGVDMGGTYSIRAFGGTSFASNTSSNFVIRMITILAMLFFILSLVIGNMSANHSIEVSQWDNLTSAKKMDYVNPEGIVNLPNDIPQ